MFFLYPHMWGIHQLVGMHTIIQHVDIRHSVIFGDTREHKLLKRRSTLP
jgi:hypothetical protein